MFLNLVSSIITLRVICLMVFPDSGYETPNIYYTDGMFKGIYNGKQCHLADISTVLSRAWSAGVDRIIVNIFQLFNHYSYFLFSFLLLLYLMFLIITLRHLLVGDGWSNRVFLRKTSVFVKQFFYNCLLKLRYYIVCLFWKILKNCAFKYCNWIGRHYGLSLLTKTHWFWALC